MIMKYKLTLEKEDNGRKLRISTVTDDMDNFSNFMLGKTYNIDVETKIIRKLYEELVLKITKQYDK